MSKLVPLGRNVIIRDRVKEAKKGSIVIPDNAQEKSYEAVVVALGPDVPVEGNGRFSKFGVLNENETVEIDQLPVSTKLKVGDVDIYGKFLGDEVTVDGEKYRLLKDTDILAKIV